MSHTPGPWEPDYWGDREIDIYSADGSLVCQMRGGSTDEEDDSEPDARLIAAAPELLSELKLILSMWEEAIDYEKDWMDLADPARAAIAKAEGGE